MNSRNILLQVVLVLIIGIAISMVGNSEPSWKKDNSSPIDNISSIDNISPLVGKPASIEIIEVVTLDEDEYLKVRNLDKSTRDLRRWSLSINDRMLISLPLITLAPESKVVIHIGAGNSTEENIYLEYPTPVLDGVGKISLQDENGISMAEKNYM